ncbi:TetR/AcrR family transcriptional regulator [Bacillus sp. SB49]|uniref:TetR/AcrR family transcriptional regulator n=1 Tax=Bacillus sp. SB49 TaxID=1071080 RepID=UPI0003F98738|nr:TetR/AcrR family transcriptional regulator [Bacillus sp. SB49]QHT47936.1 TetR/AcrR family transcriptional regulator [Bacillus sp. SB49]
MKKSSKKEAIMETAEALFYEHGFHSVGVKKILEQADVATMTMYYHFKSKEELIAAVLREREKQYFMRLDLIINKDGDAEAYIDSIVEAHLKWVEEEGMNGCMFLRAKQEYAGANEDISSLTQEHKQKLIDKIAKDLRFFKNGESLSVQISILLEGITSMAQILDIEKVKAGAGHLADTIKVQTRK